MKLAKCTLLLVIGFLLGGNASVYATWIPEATLSNLLEQRISHGAGYNGNWTQSSETKYTAGLSVRRDGSLRFDRPYDTPRLQTSVIRAIPTPLGFALETSLLKVADNRYYGPSRNDTAGNSAAILASDPGQSIVDGAVRPEGDFPRFRYGPKRGPTLPDKDEILSEVVCEDPLTKQICWRVYEQFPGAVWRYRYYSMTERRAAADSARQFARRNGGFVQREGATYVVSKPGGSAATRSSAAIC